MRNGRHCLVALALMGVLALACSPVSAQSYSRSHSRAQVDVGTFYDDLAPYGEWVEMPDYGWSWAPHVARGWRPYTRGQWVMTDDGWFWESDEQFGWATYHYGRWVNDLSYGWMWIPDTEWAPAWVSWRHGNGYTGWAPLPPRVTWRARIGLTIGGRDIDAFIGTDDYAFVPDRAFVDRGIYRRVLPPTQNVSHLRATNNVTNYSYANDRVYNGGVPVATVERAVGRSLPRVHMVDAQRANAPRGAKAGEIAVFRPVVNAAPARRPTQGRSLVKGEQPPPLLAERRSVLEQERQQKGGKPGLTAKDAQQAQRAQRANNQQQIDQQHVNQANAARARSDKRALDVQQAQQASKANNQQRSNQRQINDQQHVNQANAARARSDKRAQDVQQAQQAQKANNQQRINQRQINDQQHVNQANAARAQSDKRAKDAQATQQAQKVSNQQQLNQQHVNQAKPAKAQPDRRAKDAEPAAKEKHEKGHDREGSGVPE